MTDREKTIAEIREALEKATPGPWAWEFIRTDTGVTYHHIMAVGADNPARGEGICDTYHRDPFPFEWAHELEVMPATFGKKENAHLIANAPTWLRWQQGEIERITAERDQYAFEADGYEREMKEALKDNERLREERDKLIEVLLFYADHRTYAKYQKQYDALIDGGQRARDILKEIGVTVDE